MKSLITLGLMVLFFCSGFTQTGKSLKLEECYQMAKANHPLQKQSEIIANTHQLRLEKIDLERQPTLSWNANTSFQSEAVNLPLEIPNIELPNLPLYRIQTSLDANYMIYDGGLSQAKKDIEVANLQIEQQSVEVDLAKLKSQINQYYFGILLLEEKQKILENNLKSLEGRLELLQAGVNHGVILESEAKKLEVEIVKLNREIEQTKGDGKGLRANLSYLIKAPVDQETILSLPDTKDFSIDILQYRPEIVLLEKQREKLFAQNKLNEALRRPKVMAFAQAGLGYPNPLNFFDDSLSPFGLIGAQFSWTITGQKKAKNDAGLINMQGFLIENQKQVFEYQLNQFDEKTRSDLNTLQNQLSKDQEIVALQAQISEQMAAQLDNGIITATDYLIQLNAEIQAQLELQTHRLQIEQIKVNYLTHKGE